MTSRGHPSERMRAAAATAAELGGFSVPMSTLTQRREEVRRTCTLKTHHTFV